MSIKASVVTGALKKVNIRPDFKRKVKNRCKAMFQGKGVSRPFDPAKEFERAKDTQYRLIYPLDKSHPRFEITEMAIDASKKVTVGASVRQIKAKTVPKEAPAALVSQVKMLIPKPRPIRSSSSASAVEPRLIAPRPVRSASSIGTVVEPKVIAPVPNVKPQHESLHAMIVQRIPPIQSLARGTENAPIFVQCVDLPPMIIDLGEEFERLEILRHQAANALILGIAEQLERLAQRPTTPPKKPSEPRPLILNPGSMMLRSPGKGLHCSIVR
jgi:hypothetical protein